MGAEREDTDPHPKRVGTEPGLGKTPASAESGPTPAFGANAAKGDAPPPVDFDALHAALGDPLDFDELPPAANEIDVSGDSDDLLDGLGAAGDPPERVGESAGQSSATYASARPHTIPPSYSPTEDLNAPPVIVASEDTVPSAPPQMTVRVAQAGHPIGQTPQSGVPFVAGPGAGMLPGGNSLAAARPSGPHLGHASSGPHPHAAPASPSYPHTPQAFPIHPIQQRGPAQMTMRMPERPVNPRRAKTPTLLVRVRAPSPKQKLVVFMTSLLLVTACGIAMIIWRQPRWLGLDRGAPSAAPNAPASGGSSLLAPSASPDTTSLTALAATTASGATAVASASASAKVRPLRPAPPAPVHRAD